MKWVLIWLALAVPVGAQTITLASTTSTQNSGLYDFLLPQFTAQTGIEVRVVAVGTGQALRIARNGDADILIVHHRPSEEAFVADGSGIDRRDVMYNDFVLIGPADDPAGLRQATSAREAMQILDRQKPLFISRGDDSGTHKREQDLWQATGTVPAGPWYREIGAGMGAALNMAAATGGYLVADRGTWLSFGNKANLDILFEGDTALHNPYGVILVNPERHPHVDVTAARQLSDWMISPRGQRLIGAFRIDGKQLFCPLAHADTNKSCPSTAD